MNDSPPVTGHDYRTSSCTGPDDTPGTDDANNHSIASSSDTAANKLTSTVAMASPPSPRVVFTPTNTAEASSTITIRQPSRLTSTERADLQLLIRSFLMPTTPHASETKSTAVTESTDSFTIEDRDTTQDEMAGHFIQLSSAAQAEKVFALLHGMSLPSTSTTLQLHYRSRAFTLDVHHRPISLFAKHVPQHISIAQVYDIFRRYGPIFQCQKANHPSFNDRIDESTYILSFLSSVDVDTAQKALHQTELGGRTIAVCKASAKSQIKKQKSFRKGDALASSREHTVSNKSSPSLSPFPSVPLIGTPLPVTIPYPPPPHHYPSPFEQPCFELRPSMDLCNLYVKHVDSSTTSAQLFNLFEPYGRIISARVMEDTTTGRSKGFGFVSFSHPVEAASALIDMHRRNERRESSLQDKKSSRATVIVRFHEPKVARTEHDFFQQMAVLAASPLRNHFYTSAPLMTPSPSLKPVHCVIPSSSLNPHPLPYASLPTSYYTCVSPTPYATAYYHFMPTYVTPSLESASVAYSSETKSRSSSGSTSGQP
ncbi:uncharacterized protein BYT42DRAFT_648134 [Radiomyces spectabilis]|uniref:uncharacterized protein n=1 Tax=Radiomyces spectabilis TaxID=64574 RepID=UPI00221EAE0F|nr:uncharacterized protein BYT42DRAFT_648134 [Radiomyces spectabilis]KAI8369458.1 hypothetical protein BYT42DRAFT_648134 [Radiomyces spectabilis]